MSTADPVADEWRRRVDAEYRSAAITQEFVLWLIQLGASLDLIRDGLRIVDDELEHARLSHEVFVAAGGVELTQIDRAELGLARQQEDLESDVVLACVRVYCFGETAAVPLFRNLRRRATEPVARGALDRIVFDEGRHSAFGWRTLDWLGDWLGPDWVAEIVAPDLPSMLKSLTDAYGSAPDEDWTNPELRRWGLAPGGEYAAILDRVVEHELVPRLRSRGIEREAFDARRPEERREPRS